MATESIGINVDGFVYVSFWDGQIVKPRSFNDILKGEYCAMRDYHDLSLMEVGGKRWVKEYHPSDDADDPTYDDYEVYFSTCGYYKVVKIYHEIKNTTKFVVYRCVTWKRHMKSTFGNHVKEIGDNCFSCFEDAAKEVNIVCQRTATNI